ncbi:MAG: Asp-tRNA(Asn)/Glu-tRNA(Gln) amidotransferase subunit GatA [Kiritimatiellaeota bacterium]|nr:Asp-tRNA(Asn)/Glu-tRNA(Gln) amidotransferase subunit GatA [Kiritimatiellota bacterium]
MSSLVPPTLADIADRLGRGEVTSVEICEEFLSRFRAVDGLVGAFVHLDEDAVLASARASDARRAGGHPVGRLDGVPVALKDLLAVAGQPCTCGSRILEGYICPYDATVVARLRAQGVVLFGRTNMDEFAMGSTTENSALGVTSNPWRSDCVPGGSSGGSAAAVAAGEVPAALGSDTGGSVRQPAAFCGVVGLKPTYGRVSRYGLVAYASSLDQIGPITHTVRDAALLLDVIGGHDPRDSTALPGECTGHEAALERADIKGMRIGIPAEYFEVDGLAPEVRRSVEAVGARLQEQGANPVEVSLPHLKYAVATYYIIATAEASANLARYEGIRYGRRVTAGDLLGTYHRTRAEGFGPEVKRRIILGTYVLSSGYYDAYYRRAQKVRTLIRRDFIRAFEKCDLILSPTAPTAAPVRGGFSSPLEMYLADIYTISANLAGICGISVPCGMTDDGRPIGVQFLGPHLCEERLLCAAHVFQQISPFQPQIATAPTDGLQESGR